MDSHRTCVQGLLRMIYLRVTDILRGKTIVLEGTRYNDRPIMCIESVYMWSNFRNRGSFWYKTREMKWNFLWNKCNLREECSTLWEISGERGNGYDTLKFVNEMNEDTNFVWKMRERGNGLHSDNHDTKMDYIHFLCLSKFHTKYCLKLIFFSSSWSQLSRYLYFDDTNCLNFMSTGYRSLLWENWFKIFCCVFNCSDRFRE